jgi:hypothetical protein
MPNPHIIEQITSEWIFPVIVDVFQAYQKTHRSSSNGSVSSYKVYASKRLNFLFSVEKVSISNTKMVSLIKLQYLFETYLQQKINEKCLYAYLQYIQSNHIQIISDIFKKCCNFKMTFTKIYFNDIDYLKFLIEYFEAIKNDSVAIFRTARCIEKINFFDFVIQQINKIRMIADTDTLILEVNEKFDAFIKIITSYLHLLSYFFVKNYTCLIKNLFNSQEKVDNYRTIKQIILLTIQTKNLDIQQEALQFFENLIAYINLLDRDNQKFDFGSISNCRGVLSLVFKSLTECSYFTNSKSIEKILNILVKYKEKTIILALNQDCWLIRLINERLDIKKRKIQALSLLRIFSFLICVSEDRFLSSQEETEQIYEKIRSYSNKRNNMIFPVVNQLLKRSKDLKADNLNIQSGLEVEIDCPRVNFHK